jgi:hypothetical protein
MHQVVSTAVNISIISASIHPAFMTPAEHNWPVVYLVVAPIANKAFCALACTIDAETASHHTPLGRKRMPDAMKALKICTANCQLSDALLSSAGHSRLIAHTVKTVLRLLSVPLSSSSAPTAVLRRFTSFSPSTAPYVGGLAMSSSHWNSSSGPS